MWASKGSTPAHVPAEEGGAVRWEDSSSGWDQAMKLATKEASKEVSLIQGLPDVGTYESKEMFWLNTQK